MKKSNQEHVQLTLIPKTSPMATPRKHAKRTVGERDGSAKSHDLKSMQDAKGAKAGTSVSPFDPLKKEVLGGAIAQVMLTTPAYPLERSVPLKGAGIYALYYSGDFPAYAALSKQNKNGRFQTPIYVGQALPAGGRKGLEITIDSAALRSRIGKHRLSIKAASNLNLDDFHYRVLVLDDTFIRLGESSLISLFAPIWNSCVDGFGNNAPGAGRSPIMSRWDTLHPGRKQARSHVVRDESAAQISSEVKTTLAGRRKLVERPLIVAVGQTIGAEATLVNLDDVVNLDSPESETN